MGGAKRMMEEEESKRQVALGIAIEAGVLEQCPSHDDCVYLGGEEIESAYKLANYKVSHGELADVFDDRREMTDIIKAVVDDNSADECYACTKNWKE
ncbi:hypothetical protein GTP45_20715 [Pseudoduganella sp. FT55W]|uniref:Uncharacterized protein n=1 Tax=Duganella rivi TaxID=2666083 RepID=A0A7X4GTG1_9BURK|nr:hypothetical protein [Duganella rivi]MYM69243.1 hypothetical protein [Duganella rivi]